MGAESDTEPVIAKTTMPSYQRAKWDDHAETFGVSRPDFIGGMVQAGPWDLLDSDE